jgi:hypothetical protein
MQGNNRDDEHKYVVASGREFIEKYNLTDDHRWRDDLDLRNIPDALHSLIEYAKAWGIPDDVVRSGSLEDAATQTLHNLVDAVRSVNPQHFDNWLSGPEVSNTEPTKEYIVFSALLMAVEEAEALLA